MPRVTPSADGRRELEQELQRLQLADAPLDAQETVERVAQVEVLGSRSGELAGARAC
jgi:hypothetical protein